MSSLIFQTFCLIGLCFILKYGSILNWPRNFLIKNVFFKDLFDCALCLGFWCGIFFGLFWGEMFFWCFYSAAVCFLADLKMKVMKKNSWG